MLNFVVFWIFKFFFSDDGVFVMGRGGTQRYRNGNKGCLEGRDGCCGGRCGACKKGENFFTSLPRPDQTSPSPTFRQLARLAYIIVELPGKGDCSQI